jgi:hypothetical protein
MSETKKKGFRREDRPGHLDPAHAARLRALSLEEHRGTSSDADPLTVFDPDADGGLGEELGQRTVLDATTGDDPIADELDADVLEDQGGPFVETSAAQELAAGVDDSNPIDADREPFPRT